VVVYLLVQLHLVINHVHHQMNGLLVNQQYDVVHHLLQLVLHLIQKIVQNIMLVIHMLDVMEWQLVKYEKRK
jgi:hypothetical protein